MDIISEFSILLKNCKNKATTIGEAFEMITNGAYLVKIANQPLQNAITKEGGKPGFLANIATNFRTISGKPLGYLDTNQGEQIVPKFWILNQIMYNLYGIPYRKDHDIIADLYMTSTKLHYKLLLISDLAY